MTSPDTLPPELAELGERLRRDPPRPDPVWARELDARATAGFPRPPRRTWSSRLPRVTTRGLAPALGFAASLVLVVGIIGFAASRGGGDRDGASGGSGGGGSSTAASPGAAAATGSAESASSSRDEEQRLARRSPSAAPGGGDAASDGRRARKQERSAALTLAARPREIDAVGDRIVRVADAQRGYVASSSVASGGVGGGGSFELRIPTARLARALADLSRLAHVRERTQSTRDITAQSVSARDRLAEARREREGLLRALGRAVTLNETASIRARLRTVNARIASARTSVQRIGNRAAYATVSVTLIAERGAGGKGQDDDGTWTPGDAFRDAVRVLEVAAGVALIALAIALPLGALALLGWLAARMAGRRRRERALDMA